ncbi:MAG: hypothetical protein L0Z62_23635 [Gemmataceae bacterium]|nr:hypothetical protein [Gemmataceae bacterium]
MFPLVHVLLAHHSAAVEREKARRLEEEECMTGYSADEAGGPWQFKIVRGTFKNAQQVEAVVQEQAEYGWVLVEVFDQQRIRFKRPASEAARDCYREGNPYATVSKASGPGCGTVILLIAALVGGLGFWLV